MQTARYCDEHVRLSVCMSVSLSARKVTFSIDRLRDSVIHGRQMTSQIRVYTAVHGDDVILHRPVGYTHSPLDSAQYTPASIAITI